MMVSRSPLLSSLALVAAALVAAGCSEETSPTTTTTEAVAEVATDAVGGPEGTRADGPEEEQPQVGKFGPPKADALPFELELHPLEAPPGKSAPELHSFCHAALPDGAWLMMGGRGSPPGEVGAQKTGLHGFSPSAAPNHDNFPAPSFNTRIWVYHPLTGETASFDTNQLDRELASVLQTTSQQFWYDREGDWLWIVGGYGWKQDRSDMVTYDTLTRVSVSKLAAAVRSGAPASQVAALFTVVSHEKLKVTGGDLIKHGNLLYVVFGQIFDGQYFAFGDDDPEPFTQIYTEEIRAVTLIPDPLEILDVSAVGNADRDECHRRDLNVRMTRDATTGKPLVGIYGGVFRSGGPGGFDNPILFDPGASQIKLQEHGSQLFNAYATAVASIWAADAGVMSQVFFGGIGRGVYHTHDQTPGLDDDGMPFGSDVSVFTHHRDGSWKEFVLEDPMPGNQLLATNGAFLINPELRTKGQVVDHDVIALDSLPAGEKVTVGWVYGGILADLPQPPKGPSGTDEVPTRASDQVFEVTVTRKAGTAIPVLGDS